MLLLGPQVGFRKDAIAKDSGKPVGVISPIDYGIGNAENVIKQAKSLINN